MMSRQRSTGISGGGVRRTAIWPPLAPGPWLSSSLGTGVGVFSIFGGRVGVGVRVGVGLLVGLGVRVGFGVLVGSGVRVGFGVLVGSGVRVGLGVLVGFGVRVTRGVAVGVGVYGLPLAAAAVALAAWVGPRRGRCGSSSSSNALVQSIPTA
jgi:hypothetical protein